MEKFIELMVLLFTAGGFAIAFITLKHKFKRDEQQRHQDQIKELLLHNEWKKNIEFDIEKLKLEGQELRNSENKSSEEIWATIEEIQQAHNKDMKESNAYLNEVLKEIRSKNEDLIKMLTNINNTVIELKTELKGHKEEHHHIRTRTTRK